jgi:hypothetical protein
MSLIVYIERDVISSIFEETTFIDGETNPLFFLIQLAILSKILVVVIIYI